MAIDLTGNVISIYPAINFGIYPIIRLYLKSALFLQSATELPFSIDVVLTFSIGFLFLHDTIEGDYLF